MKPVKQTRVGKGGNCFSACIASIFEIELDEVPDLAPREDIEGPEQDKILNDWLIQFGLRFFSFRLHDKKYAEVLFKNVFHTICGTSPRDPDLDHIVVGFNGEMIHDPHPDGVGVKGFLTYGVFFAVDPFKTKKTKIAMAELDAIVDRYDREYRYSRENKHREVILELTDELDDIIKEVK